MGRENLERLLQQAKSPDPEERFEAVGELTYYYSPEVDEALVQAAADPDPDVAATAVRELAERGHPRARELVLSHLHSKNPIVRFSALRDAGVVDITPHLEPAWRALDSRVWVERMAGAGALARAGVVAALPKIHALAERARAVRQYAAEAHLLGSAALLGDQESADLFLSRLAARSSMSSLPAAAFLGRRGRLEALAEIVGLDRLRAALLAGKQVQERSPKPRYARRFEKLLQRLDQTSTPS